LNFENHQQATTNPPTTNTNIEHRTSEDRRPVPSVAQDSIDISTGIVKAPLPMKVTYYVEVISSWFIGRNRPGLS